MLEMGDSGSDDSASGGSSVSSVIVAWFTRGVFQYFVFDDTVKKAKPGSLSNMSGDCTLCPNKSVKGRLFCTTNYVRHLRVRISFWLAIFLLAN